jgi:lipoate-protein ligase B
MTRLDVHDLGRIGYAPALELQAALVEHLKQPAYRDEAHLLLLEHDPPVITLGRRGKREDILLSEADIARRGIEIHDAKRGGEVTYHGPGQLVAYAILRVNTAGRTVRGHVHRLEESVIRALATFEIFAHRRDGLTGVWVGEDKIAAIGVAVHRWITYHGLAWNISTDLSNFQTIVPCGQRVLGVTSLAKCLGRDVRPDDVKRLLADMFAAANDLDEVEFTSLPAGISP